MFWEDEEDLSKSVRYTNGNDAVMRLHCTVLNYKNSPIYIGDMRSTEPLITFDAWYLRDFKTSSIPPESKKFLLKPEDPELSLESPRLGYVNMKETAFYFTRHPERKQKQGLDLNRIRGSKLEHQTNLSSAYFVDLANTIQNIYPEPAQFINSPLEGAFSRDFAVYNFNGGIKVLAFRNDIVGFFRKNKSRCNILPDFQSKLMFELLEEKGVQL